MTGYHWTPPRPRPDPGTIIAVLRRDNHRLREEVEFWRRQACFRHGCQS